MVNSKEFAKKIFYHRWNKLCCRKDDIFCPIDLKIWGVVHDLSKFPGLYESFWAFLVIYSFIDSVIYLFIYLIIMNILI